MRAAFRDALRTMPGQDAHGVCTENLDSDVLMMQPADHGIRHNASDPLNRARDRRILSQGAMSSRRVVIARIGFYESAQVLLTQCDDMVNTFASDRPNQPFHEAILPRRARRNWLVADTHGDRGSGSVEPHARGKLQ